MMEYMNQNGKEISMIITYMGVKYRLFSALFIVDCFKTLMERPMGRFQFEQGFEHPELIFLCYQY